MASTATVTRSFRQGVTAISPVLLGVLPFGLAAGVATAEAGYGPLETVGHSVLIFAGASQIAAVSLLGDGAPVVVVVLTVLVINLRMLMYAASLSPHMADVPLRRRALGAYLLTDQAYAVSITEFQEPSSAEHRWGFYLGAAVTLWLPWQLSTVTGAVVGASLPDAVPLGFAVPLMFLALLVPAVTDRATLAAAVTSATLATLGAGLPSNLGMLLGALCGIVVGATIAITSKGSTEVSR
jgi:4-azaleucine resistance transporter AzlC